MLHRFAGEECCVVAREREAEEAAGEVEEEARDGAGDDEGAPCGEPAAGVGFGCLLPPREREDAGVLVRCPLDARRRSVLAGCVRFSVQ